jgi:MarR family transcriptional regulator, 2-MHQ and catechol-resistance regulon repressor
METTQKYGHREDVALTMWVKLARASAVFSHKTEEHIRSCGLTVGQFGVLEILNHKGPLTLGELCRKSLVSGGNMTVVVDNLERDGLVHRMRNDEDRRVIHVRLTAKGESLIRKIFPDHAGFVARLAAALTEDEQVKLGALLKKLGTGIAGRKEEETAPRPAKPAR